MKLKSWEYEIIVKGYKFIETKQGQGQNQSVVVSAKCVFEKKVVISRHFAVDGSMAKQLFGACPELIDLDGYVYREVTLSTKWNSVAIGWERFKHLMN